MPIQNHIGYLPEPPPPNLKPDNPFTALAKKWEQESRELRLDPDRGTPKHIAKKRFEEIGKLLHLCAKEV